MEIVRMGSTPTSYIPPQALLTWILRRVPARVLEPCDDKSPSGRYLDRLACRGTWPCQRDGIRLRHAKALHASGQTFGVEAAEPGNQSRRKDGERARDRTVGVAQYV